MAESPSHKFGQYLGDFLESLCKPELEKYCKLHNLYLDNPKKNRPARHGKKVTWIDLFGNSHDLDFVIEREGNDLRIGQPVGFIEVAWRRYTKHSRNKAQEIEGAILPLENKFKWSNPFLGTIIGGEFTSGSIDQLKSNGFKVLYFQYEKIVNAFLSEGIDIGFDEDTPDSEFSQKLAFIEKADPVQIDKIKRNLKESSKNEINAFFTDLDNRLKRFIEKITLIPLYGRVNEFNSIFDAINFLDKHSIYEGSGEFRKYEIYVDFSNGDKVQAYLSGKDKVIEFFEFVSRQ